MGKEIFTVRQIPQMAHEKRMSWMEQAIREGALSKLPRHTTLKQWENQQNIGIAYAFGDVTYRDLGQLHGRTNENIRQLSKRFARNLWRNSSPALQVQYPLGEIPFGKPLGPKSQERASEAQGGLSLRVKNLIETGVTDPKQIKNTLGISTDQLCRARISLMGWNVDISQTYEPLRKHSEIVEKMAKEDDDNELQKILDSFSSGSLTYFLRRDFNRKTLILASAIANNIGFHIRTSQVRSIAQTIREAKIPIGQIALLDKNRKLLGSYYIVCSKHTERIARALENNPDLQRFR